MHLGLFAHYMFVGKPYKWGSTEWANGKLVQSLDELADNLNVQDFADTAETMGAQYVMFTAWHANMNALFPSKTMRRQLPGHCSRRDAIADLIHALKAKHIRTVLYIHPSDGHDLTIEDQDRVGWNDGAPWKRWNDFINELVAEVVARYGKNLSGFYIDGGLPPQVDPPRLRRTVLAGMPHAWMIQNSGLNRDLVDFGATENRMVPPYPPTTWLRCQVITEEWWAMQATCQWSPELAYRYTVLQAAVTGRMGGGVAWSFGPQPGGTWEVGVRGFCQGLGELVRRAGPSLFGTRPSKAWVTTDQPLEGRQFVATESADGKRSYIHLFIPPKGREIVVSAPANGKRFTSAYVLGSGHKIALSETDKGLHLTLGEKDKWDAVDTIIELE